MPSASVKMAATANPGLRRERSHRVDDVGARVVQPAERSRVTLMLLRLFDAAAERAACREPRLGFGHALREELVFEQPQVRRDFAREIVFRAAEPDE